MEVLLQTLGLSVIGVALIWFGYTLFFRQAGGRPTGDSEGAERDKPAKETRRAKPDREIPPAHPGSSRFCPVCSAALPKGEQVKSSVFPKLPGQDRLMHVFGCGYCMGGARRRFCPVCSAVLADDEFLVARMFEKPGRAHVHVLGCSQCRTLPLARN
ncbi:MAG: hypothetical protein LBD37_06615 [Treponema sp.]|jgi:predicted nucleic acid-binding Zn ribbon protein|nr:hypothetical protein [Treponema sp.]